MSSSSLVELRPDRRLLDHNFEGYKLNLQALPHYSCELTSSVDRVYPDEVQYSFIHAKLFALHNHLVLDYWDYTYNYYYIDKKQQVRQVTFENNQTFQNKVVYDVPRNVERKSGHFHLCLTFPSQTTAVISDGAGYIHIVDTGLRNKPEINQVWQTQHSSVVLGEGKYFIILESRLQEKNDTENLHILLQSVQQDETHFSSLLTLVKFEKNNQSWSLVGTTQMKGKGVIHYAAIETSCEAIYIASDNVFKFSHDSNNDIISPAPREEIKKTIYTWLQTSEDITVTLKLGAGFDKKLMNVNVTPINVKISYAGINYVEGKLCHSVDSELTTWNIQDDGQVDILLTKSESMLWDELVEGGDKKGEQVLDASLVEEAHRRLAHLCSETEVMPDEPKLDVMQELEECDAASEEDTMLVRLDTIKHQITHRAPLSVHQYLFNITIETNEVPAIALRHDVDACIWQPYAQLVNSETWPMKHQGTLMAFGYVQSSKQNRKFVTCPPNFSYSVVCEAKRHIFIYQSANNQDCQLRKRTGGVMTSIKVGQQHVVNIDKFGEVIGINATNEYLFVLTETSLIAIHIV